MAFKTLAAKCAVCFFCVFLSACHSGIEPFASDGCSSFPDGTLAQSDLWLACCTAHDYAYWQGGTYDQRLEADKALGLCVNAVGEPEIGALMLAGVRVGGTPYLPTSYRWGYGWSYPKMYSVLTEEELAQIKVRETEAEQ